MTVCTTQVSGAIGGRRHRDFDELAQVLLAPILEDGHAEPVRGRVGYRKTDQTGPGIIDLFGSPPTRATTLNTL